MAKRPYLIYDLAEDLKRKFGLKVVSFMGFWERPDERELCEEKLLTWRKVKLAHVLSGQLGKAQGIALYMRQSADLSWSKIEAYEMDADSTARLESAGKASTSFGDAFRFGLIQ